MEGTLVTLVIDHRHAFLLFVSGSFLSVANLTPMHVQASRLPQPIAGSLLAPRAGLAATREVIIGLEVQ
jgi:hypothetical protein